jgi:hypothetical protein
MPLLTTQSAKGYGWGSLVDTAVGNYYSIASTSLTTSSATISFSSIPSTYDHLQIRGSIRGTVAGSQQTAAIRLNGDSGNNYAAHTLLSKNNTPSSYKTGPADMMEFYEGPGGNQASGVFGNVIIDILDYKNTNKNTVIKTIYAWDNNTTAVGGTQSATVSLFSGLWLNTAAVTSVTLIEQAGTNNYAANTTWSLYGIKGV